MKCFLKSKYNLIFKEKNVKDFLNKKCKICDSSKIKLKYVVEDYDIFKCNNCSVVFLDFHKDFDISKLYSSDYYLEREEYYLKNYIVDPSCNIKSPHIDDFREGLNIIESLKPRGRLLDVGCGMGLFLFMAKQRGWDVFGVDVSDYATDFTKKSFGINCFVGDLKKASFPDKYFDVITLWDVIEHFENPIDELEEIRRILSDDGIILFDTPNAESLMRLIAHWLYKITGGIFKYPIKKLYHQFHIFYFSMKTLKILLDKSGFEIIEMKKKTIPLTKARGNKFEKTIVKGLSLLEKITGREYELFVIAQKRRS